MPFFFEVTFAFFFASKSPTKTGEGAFEANENVVGIGDLLHVRGDYRLLADTWPLKEELHEVWEQEDQQAAQALLMDWISYAESTGIRMLHDFAKRPVQKP